jgi:hypothetical protein
MSSLPGGAGGSSHTNLATTIRYLNVTDEALKRAVEKLKKISAVCKKFAR